MLKRLTTIASIFAFVACNNDGDTKSTETDTTLTTKTETTVAVLTDAEKTDGWQALFDGQSSSGWHKYGGGPVGSAWKISDGMLWLDTSAKSSDGKIAGGGDIVSNEDFENFHLKLEWKISSRGNSGVMFYVNEDTVKYKRPYETGPEMQILDNDGHADGKITKHRAGDLYDLISCTRETVKPVGEWNLAEIKSMNGQLEFYLNGEKVVATTMWDDNWKKMVAGSKFKEWKDFGTYKSGKICLQDHDNLVTYRNIRIKRL
ncbi:MAG: DUF1080 domain-containing protein [Chitinophagaceae bacterium]|nr:DUF1080 domain-containing protein [Chitinophagaceae bacterium]